MKNYNLKLAVTIYTSFAIILWLIFAFMIGKLDPMTWETPQRVALVLVWGFASTILCITQYKEN